jgi:hypothetical protein
MKVIINIVAIRNIFGVLANADDIVLVAPPQPRCVKNLQYAIEYAADYDIMFKPDKSKLLVNAYNKRLRFYNDMCACSFVY